MSLRPTPAGWVVIGLAVVFAAAGRALSYAELTVGAAGLAAALVVALACVLVARQPPAMTRRLAHDRVVSGEPVTATVTVTNSRRRHWRAGLVTDAVDGTPLPVGVPDVAGGATTSVGVTLPPLARGRYRIGPLTVVTTDPLGLVAARRTSDQRLTLWVHPRVHPVARTRSTSGRRSGLLMPTALPEGIDLHRLDDYRPGDDPRLIHWPTSLRRGSLVVRHPAPEKQTARGVLLDTAAESYADAEQFEHAVRVAASAAMAMADGDDPVRVESTGGRAVSVDADGRRRDALLDELAAVRTAPGDPDLRTCAVATRRGPLSLVVVTGEPGASAGTGEAAVIERLSPHVDGLTLLRVGPAGRYSRTRPRGGPVLEVIAAPTSEELVRAWSAPAAP